MPLVSVIVPNYNHAPYLRQRIDTVLNQTFTDFELIALDDASPDTSREVLDSYRDDPRVSLHYNETNTGSPFAQWAKGIELAKGDFIWIAESDDYADLEFLATCVPILKENPSVGLVYVNSHVINQRGTVKPDRIDAYLNKIFPNDSRWEQNYINEGKKELRDYLSRANTIPNVSATLLRRSVLQEVGLPNKNFCYAGDWEYWVRVLSVSDVAYVADRLNYYREHDFSLRSKYVASSTRLIELYQLLSLLTKSCPLHPGQLDAMRKHRAEDALYCCHHTVHRELPSIIVKLLYHARTFDPFLAVRLLPRLLAKKIRKLAQKTAPKVQKTEKNE